MVSGEIKTPIEGEGVGEGVGVGFWTKNRKGVEVASRNRLLPK
jgi:hypothetical protein